jgi:ABC-type Na+ efflux pump permease subunit
VIAAAFAFFHIGVVTVPLVLSGGSGETQAFATAIFDLPIFWVLGLFPGGRAVLYGSSPLIYMLVFGVGGTFMYAAIGALLGWAIHSARRGRGAA